MRPTGIRAGATVALLVLLGVLFAIRGARLADDPGRLMSWHEARFYQGFWRHPQVAEIFAGVEKRLAPGEPVSLLVLPSRRRQARWWRGMALYHLPGHRVVGHAVTRPEALLPGEGTVIFFAPRGEPRIYRHVALP